MRGIPLSKVVLALVLILAFGLVRLPLERRIESQMREQGFLDDNVDLPLLEKLGQNGFAAVLGGFRSLVASIYYIQAHVSAFDKDDWAKVDQLYGLITTLQPRNGHYWDQYIWHIGWNAYAWAMREADYEQRNGSEWKAWNLINVAAPAYLDRAEEVALKAAALVKDDFRLHQRIGLFYEEKFHDSCQAARWFEIGSQVEGAPGFMHKIFANLLAQCPGAEDEAYALISERYWDPDNTNRSLSVLMHMETLEDRLARRETQQGLAAVQRSIRDEPKNYLHRAALAQFYLEQENSPEKALAAYEDMENLRQEGTPVPEFYRKKWALVAAGVPEREVIAYRTLRVLLPEMRRRLQPEEEEVVRQLEEKLNVPEEARIFGGKRKIKPPARH